MEDGAADSQTVSGTKVRTGSKFAVDKLNPAKREALIAANRNPQTAQDFNAVGHNALAAGLVDRQMARVSNGNGEPTLTRRNRRGQPGWSGAHHQNVGFRFR